MRAIEASWVWSGEASALPIAAGAIVLEGARVRAYGRAAELRVLYADAAWERYEGVLIPGLVNARVCLDERAVRIDGGRGWIAWMRARKEAPSAQAIEDTVRAIVAAGTVAIGEVVTALEPIESGARPILTRRYREVAGVHDDTATVMRRLAEEDHGAIPIPHSLLALPPDHVAALASEARAPMLLRLSFCEAERAYLEEGSGPYAEWLAEIGSEPSWRAPGLSPIDAAAAIGAIGPGVVATHLTDARPHELRALAATRTRTVLCPRASAYVELKLPPLDDILAAGLTPGLGTDAPACAGSPDVLHEAIALHERFAHVPPSTILAMATSWGAQALGFHALGVFARDHTPGAVLFAGSTRDPLAHVLAGGPRRVLADTGT
jgi:cytosine/adenosine deaminase-related metal-dependent hydrolase